MIAMGSGSGPDSPDADSWTSETLPMSVRKELLERELKKLGLHRGARRSGASPQANVQQQQQPQPAQPPAERPLADGEDKPRGD
jgi:hypothetical protein